MTGNSSCHSLLSTQSESQTRFGDQRIRSKLQWNWLSMARACKRGDYQSESVLHATGTSEGARWESVFGLLSHYSPQETFAKLSLKSSRTPVFLPSFPPFSSTFPLVSPFCSPVFSQFFPFLPSSSLPSSHPSLPPLSPNLGEWFSPSSHKTYVMRPGP